MCNKVNTQEFMLIVRSRYLYCTHDLVQSLSVEFKPHDFIFFIINLLTILESFYGMFEKARGCTLIKKNLVCSMIMISENAAPMTLMQGIGSLVQL